MPPQCVICSPGLLSDKTMFAATVRLCIALGIARTAQVGSPLHCHLQQQQCERDTDEPEHTSLGAMPVQQHLHKLKR